MSNEDSIRDVTRTLLDLRAKRWKSPDEWGRLIAAARMLCRLKGIPEQGTWEQIQTRLVSAQAIPIEARPRETIAPRHRRKR